MAVLRSALVQCSAAVPGRRVLCVSRCRRMPCGISSAASQCLLCGSLGPKNPHSLSLPLSLARVMQVQSGKSRKYVDEVWRPHRAVHAQRGGGPAVQGCRLTREGKTEDLSQRWVRTEARASQCGPASAAQPIGNSVTTSACILHIPSGIPQPGFFNQSNCLHCLEV